MDKKSFSVCQTWRPIQTHLTVLYIMSSQQKKKTGGAGSGENELFSALMKAHRVNLLGCKWYVPGRGSSLSDLGQIEKQ